LLNQRQLLKEKVRHALASPRQRDALSNAMLLARTARNNRIASLPDGDAFRHAAKKIKQRCAEDHVRLLADFQRNAEARGAHVLLAEDARAAIAGILDILREHGARRVTKSKSITTEEIELNDALEAADVEVFETDLGELIVQLLGDRPFHTIAPAVHKTAADVAELFTEVTKQLVPDDVGTIMQVVRNYLRPIFLDAQVGVSGGNVGIAEAGVVAILTNEGNEQLVTGIPDVHICVMGADKIVESFEDAVALVTAVSMSVVGQRIPTYLSFIGGKAPMSEADGTRRREQYFVVLDNGRSRMREDPDLKEALNCVRCSACLGACPTFSIVGGHTFGHIYQGPIGIPWTAAVHGLDQAGAFSELCIACGLCKEICPVDIDIPMMIAKVKERNAAKNPASLASKAMMSAASFARVGSATAPVSNWALGNAAFRWALEKTVGVDRHCTLPQFARTPLHRRLAQGREELAEGVRRVVYFVDLYADYNAPELGQAVIHQLEAAGCHVIVPPQAYSGYPYFAYGDVTRARDSARACVALLAPYLRAGYEIVSTEPTATHCLKELYPSLLDHDPGAEEVAAHSHSLFGYLLKIGGDEKSRPGKSASESKPLQGRKLGFHISCHQRPLDSGRDAIRWLEAQGAEVVVVETGTCCGMGGTFGMKAGPLGRELALAAGATLFQRFRDAGVDTIVTESSVCKMHVGQGTGIKVYHPLELLMMVAET